MSNFFQRLGPAMRFAFSGSKQLVSHTPTWRDGRPNYSPARFENMVRDGWRKNELIFACISKTANTSAQVQLQVVQRDGVEYDAHPMIDLIHKPNPFMSEFDFWSAIIIYQKLAGVAYFEKRRSRIGLPVELWPMRPDWVAPIEDKNTFISAYEYRVPGIEPVRIPAQDVLRFPLFDPLNMYHGWPPAAVAGRVGDVDNATTDYLKLFFEKGGTPPGILTTVQRLVDTEVADIRRRWRERYGGIQGWLEPAVLDADAKYQQIGSSFKDMGFETLDGRNEARICMVMMVPPILVGAKVGLDRATYANYGEARLAWWQDDLVPMYANYQDVLDNQLAVEWGDDIRTSWNLSKVWALQEAVDKRWARATEALKAGGLTVNQFNREIGLDPIGPSGDVYLRSTMTVEVPAKSVRKGDLPQLEQKAAGNAPDDDERRKQERQMQQEMEAFFEAQMKRVVKDVRSNGR